MRLNRLELARAEAIADARALMSTAMIGGHTIFGRSIEIRDEAGALLLVLPFTDAYIFYPITLTTRFLHETVRAGKIRPDFAVAENLLVRRNWTSARFPHFETRP